jgi:imidazole glycerol phosphate synthase glutamine amidotransferase subunit
MITILDYGAGNLRSVQNTLAEVGAAYRVVDQASEIDKAARIILPGVGHFGQMIRALDAMKAREPLVAAIRGGVPFLGICLGLQALFARSEEAPDLKGLGIFEESVTRFPAQLRVPHMGWNQLTLRAESRLVRPGDYMYFANSYYAPVMAATTATCTYSLPFTAVLEEGNVAGVQFHPEKSGPAGLDVVRRFAC